MSERFFVAAAVVAGVLLIGLLVRFWSARRNAVLIDSLRLHTEHGALPTVLAFSGPGCDACAVQKRILSDLVTTSPGGIEVRYLDAVTDVAEAQRFGVIVVPTTVVAGSDGLILAINSGLVSADRLKEQLAAASATAMVGPSSNADEWFQSSPWALV